jgi:hypothetical protein
MTRKRSSVRRLVLIPVLAGSSSSSREVVISSETATAMSVTGEPAQYTVATRVLEEPAIVWLAHPSGTLRGRWISQSFRSAFNIESAQQMGSARSVSSTMLAAFDAANCSLWASANGLPRGLGSGAGNVETSRFSMGTAATPCPVAGGAACTVYWALTVVMASSVRQVSWWRASWSCVSAFATKRSGIGSPWRFVQLDGCGGGPRNAHHSFAGSPSVKSFELASNSTEHRAGRENVRTVVCLSVGRLSGQVTCSEAVRVLRGHAVSGRINGKAGGDVALYLGSQSSSQESAAHCAACAVGCSARADGW